MTTDVDKHFMLTGATFLSEPFDFGRTLSTGPQPDSLSSGSEEGKQDSNIYIPLLQRFADETSAHGCTHLNSSYRGTVWRCLWALAVVGMLCAMIFTLYSMLSAYDEYPVNTLTKVTVKHALPFPGVTLCNINEVDTYLVPMNGTQFRDTKVALIFGVGLNESDPGMKEVLDTPIQLLVNSSWILPGQCFNMCLINNRRVHCSDIFSTVQSSKTKCVTLNTTHPSLQSISNTGPISGLRLYLDVHQDGYVYDNSVSAGVKMFIHEPGQSPDFQGSGILLSPGFSHYVSTRQTDYSFLSKPYMAYGDEACVDVRDPTVAPQLRISKNYSFHMCILQCVIDQVAERCGCRGVLNSALVYFNVSSDNKCQCPRPCQYTEYQTEISSAYFPSDVATATLQRYNILPKAGVRENYMELRVYLAKLVLEEVVHAPVYTYTSVMGTIGGQMGFFLGASVLTVAEVVELLVCFVFRFLRQLSGPRERRVQARVIPVQQQKKDTDAAATS